MGIMVIKYSKHYLAILVFKLQFFHHLMKQSRNMTWWITECAASQSSKYQ